MGWAEGWEGAKDSVLFCSGVGRTRNAMPAGMVLSQNRNWPALRAALAVVARHGVAVDRCEVLQDLSTLVVRLSETLVARVVQDVESGGARRGTAWMAREIAVAEHLTRSGAPVIPLHGALPPGPHEEAGFPMNFWEYVERVPGEPEPRELGRQLRVCHARLQPLAYPLPVLGILEETLGILGSRTVFPAETQGMLVRQIKETRAGLARFPQQPLHGDAHTGNAMLTTRGLLWTDWEDAFLGPVEWDVASLIWNARELEGDDAWVAEVVAGYGAVDAEALELAMTARAAVVCAWYPLLYPEPDAARREKLARRLEWLRQR